MLAALAAAPLVAVLLALGPPVEAVPAVAGAGAPTRSAGSPMTC
jgi:hypothetical protein